MQELLTKVYKGVGNNKLIPLTSMLLVNSSNGVLTLGSTDANNYLFVKKQIDDKSEFNVVVNADVFSNLISKFTTEITCLEVDNWILNIVGNGEYKLDIQVDETGEVVKFPNPVNQFHSNTYTTSTVKASVIKEIIVSIV